MSKLNKFLSKKNDLITSMNAILASVEKEDRLMSEEEVTSFENSKVELAKINSQIDLVQGFESNEVVAPVKSNAITASNAIPALSPKKEFSDLGEFMQAVIFNPNDQRLDYAEYKNELRTDSGSKGGFAIPKQFISTIYEQSATPAVVRPRATVIPAGTPPDAEVSIPALDQEPDADGNNQVYAGVEIEKVEEGGQKPLTTLNLREISLKPREMAAIIPMTDKLLRNWQAATTFAERLLRSAIVGFEDRQFFLGNGVGGPAGALLSSSRYLVTRTTSNQVNFADIKAMETRFAGVNGIYVASRAVKAQLLNMVGDGGGATNIVSVDGSSGAISLYGRPVIFSDRLNGLGAIGDFALCDFSQYLIKDGSGPIVEVGFDDGQFRRNKRSIKVTFNVDGQSWLTKPYKGEDDFEISPFVVLGLPAGS